MSAVLKGRTYKMGDDVDTDIVIAARYLVTGDAKELGKHCMETHDPDFPKKVAPGDILVAGKNFGCGSSREHAPLAIKGAGISCVIAKTFARIFFRNSINIGLPILESAEAAADVRHGDQLEVDLAVGEIRNITRGRTYRTSPFPEFLMKIIAAGGLMPHVAAKAVRHVRGPA